MRLGGFRLDSRGALTARSKVALALEIVVAYAHVRWLLWRRDFRTALGGVRGVRRRPLEKELGDPGLVGIRLGNAVVRTLTLLPTDSRCLMRSLVLVGLLERRGIRSTLVLGVNNETGFAAHAWVEHEGRPLLASGGDRFGRLVEL